MAWNAWRLNKEIATADLSYAKLAYTNLSGTNLSGADLADAKLASAKLERTDFNRSSFGGTIISKTDLSVAKGLDNVRHNAPSSIGIDTLYLSKGKIPEIF